MIDSSSPVSGIFSFQIGKRGCGRALGSTSREGCACLAEVLCERQLTSAGGVLARHHKHHALRRGYQRRVLRLAARDVRLADVEALDERALDALDAGEGEQTDTDRSKYTYIDTHTNAHTHINTNTNAQTNRC